MKLIFADLELWLSHFYRSVKRGFWPSCKLASVIPSCDWYNGNVQAAEPRSCSIIFSFVRLSYILW